ncbi:MAG: dihydrofolate reductase [Clostridiales bacterium]|nr:dihydrofolate reductase [Clostridiales bacterium]
MQAIVAVSQSWGIGKGGDLLFRLPSDLRRFKSITTGHTVIMGRKTLDSLPGGKGLPHRRNLVLSRQSDFAPDRAEVIHSVEDILKTAEDDAFVIGGQQVYEQLLPYCARVYVTKVLSDPEADAFFPDLDKLPEWKVASAGEMLTENGLSFQYVEYIRI